MLDWSEQFLGNAHAKKSHSGVRSCRPKARAVIKRCPPSRVPASAEHVVWPWGRFISDLAVSRSRVRKRRHWLAGADFTRKLCTKHWLWSVVDEERTDLWRPLIFTGRTQGFEWLRAGLRMCNLWSQLKLTEASIDHLQTLSQFGVLIIGQLASHSFNIFRESLKKEGKTKTKLV